MIDVYLVASPSVQLQLLGALPSAETLVDAPNHVPGTAGALCAVEPRVCGLSPAVGAGHARASADAWCEGVRRLV
eukprot:7013796-Prymnesium_polylepis.1